MSEKTAYIDSISRMLSRMDLRRVKNIYEFVLALTSPTDEEASA